MALSVNPQAHDIVFTFNDSCNCCFPSKEPKKLYINTSGEVESFKSRKALNDTSKAFQRSLAHLHQTLDHKVTTFKGDPSEFQYKTEHIIQSIYNTQEINSAHLEAINNVMLDYIAERSPSLDVRNVSPDLNQSKCEIL